MIAGHLTMAVLIVRTLDHQSINVRIFKIYNYYHFSNPQASAIKLKHTTISMHILIGSSNSVNFASQIESHPLELTNCIKCAFGEKF